MVTGSGHWWKEIKERKAEEMEILTINVYDDKDNVVKTAEAQFAEIKFGAVRSVMKLLKVDKIETNIELMEAIADAWEQLVKVLAQIFPDLTEGDFDNVKLSELVPVVVSILRKSFAKLVEIPKEKNI